VGSLLGMTTAILLSGGMDSIALAYWMRPNLALTIDYGQASSSGEIRASTKVCQELAITCEVIHVNCLGLGSGDLAGSASLPIAPVPEWWPFRNQLLITLAAMRAVSMGVARLLFGAVKTDSSHADGRIEFFERMDAILKSQEGGLTLAVPAISMSSAELIRKSGIDLALLAWSHSCHTAAYACGRCRGCNKHRDVLAELGYEAY